MQGMLSRYIANEVFQTGQTTFVPTMRKIAIPYLALDCSKNFDWQGFFNSSQGLKLEKVLCLCEVRDQVDAFKSGLSKYKAGEFPRTVICGMDAPSEDIHPKDSP